MYVCSNAGMYVCFYICIMRERRERERDERERGEREREREREREFWLIWRQRL